MKWTLVNPAGTNDPETGDIYSGLDRFGRVKDNRWVNGAGTDLDRIQYGYDRAGNRIWRRNVVAAALGKEFDELYAYDGVHRLQDMARGTLNAERTALTSENFAQCWTLDSTGNWHGFREDSDGNGTWDLIQQRTANRVNEITDISETAGPSWVTPAYSRAGNMTTMPQPADPTQSYAATYDAWNRLVKLADGADTVSEYAYDGAKRRIVQKSYSGGVLGETRHLYYTQPSQWQVLEERVGTSPDFANAERQFVWGKRYIDNLVLRDRDTDDNGSLDERLCALQDTNWNMVALIDTSVTAQERYLYSPFGWPIVLDGSMSTVRTASEFDIDVLFTGQRFDWTSHLHLFRNRYFDSISGRFITRDSLIYIDGPNAYGGWFVPSRVDPLGHLADSPDDNPNPPNTLKCPKPPKECEGGFCLMGVQPKIESCKLELTYVSGPKICKGGGFIDPCKAITKIIADLNKKNPTRNWEQKNCRGGCECDYGADKYKEGPVTIEFDKSIFLDKDYDCKYEVTGTITISEGEIKLVPCKKKD